MKKEKPSELELEVDNYYVSRYQNEQLLNVKEHKTRPLASISNSMA